MPRRAARGTKVGPAAEEEKMEERQIYAERTREKGKAHRKGGTLA